MWLENCDEVFSVVIEYLMGFTLKLKSWHIEQFGPNSSIC